MSLQCSECSRVFSIKSNLTRHLRMVHNVEVERVDILPGDYDVYHYKCLEGCNISFKYNRELRRHLRLNHQINLIELNLEFPNAEEFDKWLHNEETNNYVQYIHLTATKRKTTGTETYYYECSRTGKRSYVHHTARKRRARKWVTKLNRGCTSQIIVNKSHDGTFSINYYKTHYGHETNLEHVKLSKQDRGAVASKLLLGLPISTVLRSATKNTTGNLKRINLLGRKDIVNIRKSFNIDLKDGKLVSPEAANVNLFLTECNAHCYNPVLFCNINDFSESEDICFIIMSKNQSDILKDVGNNIIVINSLSLKNCDFELITLFVMDEGGESFPAACMFTNKIHFDTYKLFFDKIKDRVGIISPKIFITNCDEMYYNAWKCVMDDVSFNLYSPIQIDVDWRLNLNRIACTETEVTRIKRKWVYETITSLQNTTDAADFAENLEASVKVLRSDEDFSDFLQYFLKNYSDPKTWADCFKNDLDLPSKQLKVMGDVLKHYLNEEIEIRFDKIFHSLIRFIRDETVNFMLNTKTNRVFFTNENDARHKLLMEKHLNGIHVGENLWNVSGLEDETRHVVQKHLEKKCCNLICTTCRICLHCFSCSCVDFFVGNAICVHIHYIWVTYFQSIMENDEVSDERETNCGEEIIIEIDENHEQEVKDDVEGLREAIADRTSVLCCNVSKTESTTALKVILDTLNQLCDLSASGEVERDGDDIFLSDHSYL